MNLLEKQLRGKSTKGKLTKIKNIMKKTRKAYKRLIEDTEDNLEEIENKRDLNLKCLNDYDVKTFINCENHYTLEYERCNAGLKILKNRYKELFGDE